MALFLEKADGMLHAVGFECGSDSLQAAVRVANLQWNVVRSIEERFQILCFEIRAESIAFTVVRPLAHNYRRASTDDDSGNDAVN